MASVKKNTEQMSETETSGECALFVYTGPSLPGGKLKKNAVLAGKFAEITEYYKDVISEYPQIKRLIIPAKRFGSQRKEIHECGNILNKYYTDIVSAAAKKISENGEEQ